MAIAHVDHLADALLEKAREEGRFFVAVAGPPGAGKSTLCEALCRMLNRRCTLAPAVIVPMDGFHFDNAILDIRGLRARKGAPETFDADGFVALLRRLRQSPEPVAVPVFDRAMDLSRTAARMVEPHHRFVLVEGNYPLLQEEPWIQLADLFNLTIWLDVSDAVLEERLIRRWRDNGLSPDAARKRALGNDMPNARLVKSRSRPADLVLAG